MGAVLCIPDFMEIQTPKAFPNCPERWRDNLESAEDFSRGKCCLPFYAPAYFCRGAALFSPQSRWEWETQKFPPRKKVGAVFYIPDYMKIRTPRAFPNRPERWRDNPESAKDFSPGEGDSPVMHRRIFVEGRSCSPPNPAGNGKHKSSHRRKKVGAVFYIPDYMKTQAPWTFPNCSERWWDNSEGAEDFSLDEGCLPCYAPAFFHRGATLFSPQSRMGWENKTPTSFAKGGSSVYKGRTNR